MGGVLIGIQLIYFSIYSKRYGEKLGFLPKKNNASHKFHRKFFTLEKTMAFSILIVTTGLALLFQALHNWQKAKFGVVPLQHELHYVIPAVLLTVVGIQVAFSSLMLAVLEL